MPKDGGGTEIVTGRVRNARYGEYPDGLPRAPTPELDIPEAGEYLWEWYFDLSRSIHRITDGICAPIAPSEFKAWFELTGHIVYPHEYEMLAAIDLAFCDQMNEELEAKREREKPSK